MPASLGGTIRRAHAGGGPAAVRELARAGRGPVIEATDDPGVFDVTFVFADRRRAVREVGLFCAAVPGTFARLTPLGDATFAGTFPLPGTARVRYHFCPDPPADLDAEALFALAHSPTARRIDYFNPNLDQVRIRGLRARLLASLLVLPMAPAPPEPPPAGESRPAVRDLAVDAARLGRDWHAAIYLPPGHDPDRASTVVLLLENNHEWRRSEVFARLPVTGLHPFVGVLLGGGRHYTAWLRDLNSPALARFVADDVLAAVRGHCALADGTHIAAGFSAAAVGAAGINTGVPAQFSGLVAVSGAWHLGESMDVTGPPGPPRLVERYRTLPTPPRRAYLAAGRYEQSPRQPILEHTRTLSTVLAERGTSVRFDHGYTDHDAGSALAYLCEGLRWLLDRDAPA